MLGSIMRSCRRSLGWWVVRRMATAEFLGQLAKKSVRKEHLGRPALSRLVEEIISRGEGSSADSTEQARRLLKEAEKIAGEVSVYFSDASACDPAVRRILDFHVGSMPTRDGDESNQRKNG
jgi:hypothetical protein